MKKMTLMAAALAAALGSIGAAQAQQRAIVITEAPPAPVYERAPAPRADRVWVEGHYEWRNGDYRWIPGYWMTARRGMVWEQAHWVQRPNGEWTFVEGRWVPDRVARRGGGNGMGDMDGDGVANRYDRDRDGDGVANVDDRFPNNPNRG